MTQYPIVGAFYRPPAKAILDALPQDTTLLLRAEPENPHDSYAVMVVLRSADISEGPAREKLAETLPNFGFDLDEIMAQEEWHIGYIPRTVAPQVQSQLIIDGVKHDAKCTLAFAPDGKPQVSHHG